MEPGAKEYRQSKEYNELVSLIELAEKTAEEVNQLENSFVKTRTRILILSTVAYSCFGISAYVIVNYVHGTENLFYKITIILFALVVLIIVFLTIAKDFNTFKRNRSHIRVEKKVLYNLMELTDIVKRKALSEESNLSYIDKALLQMRLARISFDVDYKNYSKVTGGINDTFF